MPKFESLPFEVTRTKKGKEVPKEAAAEDVIEEESEPQIIEGVFFSEVRNRRGAVTGYKSSSLGRKEIKLADLSAGDNLDFDEPYTVRVVKDTKPEDPTKGSLLVEIVPDKPEDFLDHKGAALARAERLKESRGFGVVGEMLVADPDLAAEYKPVVARHEEYKKGLQDGKDERHRNYTGMLAGLMMSERGSTMMNHVIDRTVSEESAAYRKYIEEENRAGRAVFVSDVVNGAGVYGAVMALTRQMYLPENPSLTTDKANKIGGQFANFDGDLFRLNSRRRPEQKDMPHLPGTRQSINTFGAYAPIQPSDIGFESYGYQSSIANPARMNLFLSGRSLVGLELRRVRNDQDSSSGQLLLEYIDPRTNKVYELTTNRLTLATGLGKEISGLDEEDKITREILIEENEKRENGEEAKVFSFSQFGMKMSDKEDAHPLQGIKRIVLSGDKDSGTVVAGIALGYESALGKTATQLDFVEEIIWVGQPIETKEKFCENARARYHQVGLDFPREKFENYYHRINPIPDAQSSKLRRTKDGKIRVLVKQKGKKDEGREGLTSKEQERYVEGDIYVYAHGFKDTTDQVIAPALGDMATGRFDIERFSRRIPEAPFNFIGSVISYREGPTKNLQIVGESEEGIIVEIISRDNVLERRIFSVSSLRAERDFFDASNISLIDIAAPMDEDDGLDSRGSDVRAKIRDKDVVIAKQYDTFVGSVIYKVGPASKIPITDEERAESPVLDSIPENTAAVFRYVDRAEALAKQIALVDKEFGNTDPESLFSVNIKRKKVNLPEVAGDGISLKTFEATVKPQNAESIGLTENSADLLKLAVGDTMDADTFPESLKDIRLHINQTSTNENGTKYQISVEPGLPAEYIRLLNGLMGDTLMGGLVNKLTSNTRSKAVDIVLPFHKGRLDAARVGYSVPR